MILKGRLWLSIKRRGARLFYVRARVNGVISCNFRYRAALVG
jgi:hypothetical protein